MPSSKGFSSAKIWIIGCRGQVGSALMELLGKRALGLDFPELDLSRPAEVAEYFDSLRKQDPPVAVINAAAYTQVDRAESEKELAWKINAEGPGVMAKWCAKGSGDQSVPLVHYSTDYVYSGEGRKPWVETDSPHPLSEYGKGKLAGDQAIVKSGCHHLIFRTSWIFSESGKNFLLTMLNLGRDREELSIVGDQFGAPTYARDLAAWTLQALEKAFSQKVFPSGVYHLVNAGETTWHGFAEAIFEEYRENGGKLKIKSVKNIHTSEYPTAARRPLNSRLNLELVRERFGITPRNWREALAECMERVS